MSETASIDAATGARLPVPPPPPPSGWQQLAERGAGLFRYPALEWAAVRLSLAALVVLLCLLRAYAGLSGIRVYTHDAFGTLDGAWRVLHGQAPHADFYTPLGPLMYLLTAFGLLLSGFGAEGFGYAQAMVAGALGIWTYGLCRRRLHDVPAILMCLTVVLLALNPTAVGEPPPNTSCMPYNRYGYAIVALLLVEAFAGAERAGGGGEVRGGVSTGMALATLLFLKISYFVGGGFLLAVLVPCRRQTRARWAGMAAGFAAVSLAALAHLRFQLLPMWRDLRMAAGAKPLRWNSWIVHNLTFPVAFFALFTALAVAYFRARREPGTARNVALAAGGVLGTGMFLLATNFQFFALPLGTTMAILVMDAAATAPPAQGRQSSWRGWLLVWGCLLVAGPALYDVLGLGFAVQARRNWEAGARPAFHAGVLGGFRTYDRRYTELVNDGLKLLEANRAAGDTVVCLDFSNPFSYALGMKPPRGGATTLHYGVNISAAQHPPAARLFGDARLAMVPKEATTPGLLSGIERLYGPYLREHFQEVAESGGWWLYRRRPPAKQ